MGQRGWDFCLPRGVGHVELEEIKNGCKMKLDKKYLYFSIAVVIIGVIAIMFLSEGSEPYRTLLFFGVSVLILVEAIFFRLYQLSFADRLALVIFGIVGLSGVVLSVLIWSSLIPSSISRIGAGVVFFATAITTSLYKRLRREKQESPSH